MANLLEKQYALILDVERRFAKRIVYLIRAYTPRPWWHIFIPFKFLFEYLSMRKEVREFTAKHVYLKQIALSAGYRATESKAFDKSRQEMQAELRDFWLNVQDLESQEVYELLGQWMDMLLRHYYRLFQTTAGDYSSLIRRVYTSAGEYQSFLHQLTEVEQKLDQAVLEALGISAPDPYIQKKQQAIQDLRAREVQEIFG